MSNMIIGLIVSNIILFLLIFFVLAVMGNIYKTFEQNVKLMKKTETFLKNNNIYLSGEEKKKK